MEKRGLLCFPATQSAHVPAMTSFLEDGIKSPSAIVVRRTELSSVEHKKRNARFTSVCVCISGVKRSHTTWVIIGASFASPRSNRMVCTKKTAGMGDCLFLGFQNNLMVNVRPVSKASKSKRSRKLNNPFSGVCFCAVLHNFAECPGLNFVCFLLVFGPDQWDRTEPHQ